MAEFSSRTAIEEFFGELFFESLPLVENQSFSMNFSIIIESKFDIDESSLHSVSQILNQSISTVFFSVRISFVHSVGESTRLFLSLSKKKKEKETVYER